MKQRLNVVAFDQQTDIMEVLNPEHLSCRNSNASRQLQQGITSEDGRFKLIREILQCLLILVMYDGSNSKFKRRLEAILRF